MFSIFLLIFTLAVTPVLNTIVHPEWKIYYDIRTNQTIDIMNSNNPRSQLYKFKSISRVLRIGFGPIPCECEDLSCGCCAGMNIDYFNFNQKACMNFTYDPYDFSLKLDMQMNDESVFQQEISGKNPPPACIPVQLPVPFTPSIDFCVKLFNIHTPGYNIFMCMDFETRISRAPVLILHFDCLKMGADGIQIQKPEEAESGPDPDVEDVDNETQPPNEIEVYDEVFEDNKKNKTENNPKESKNPN